jgi:uncharacterized protein (DUF2147 family)
MVADHLPSPSRFVAGLMLFCLLVVGAPGVHAAPAPPVVGDWLTETGGGVIQIAPCPQGLCGRIVGISREPGEAMPVDYQGTSQCGLLIITAGNTSDDGIWRGHVTDPRNGKVYQAELRLDSKQRLLMRGFLAVPLFGQTQTWTRFIGKVSSECHFVMGNGPGAPSQSGDRTR